MYIGSLYSFCKFSVKLKLFHSQKPFFKNYSRRKGESINSKDGQNPTVKTQTIHLENARKTFHQRCHVSGKWAHEKLLDIISHQGNAGQNPVPCHSTCTRRAEVKGRDNSKGGRGHGETRTENGVATVENSLAVSYQTTHL